MNNSKSIYYFVSSAFALIAMFCLYYLADQHWALKLGSAGAQSFCNLNDTFNCDAVSASKFASFLGAPLALWGAVSFLMYFIVSSLAYFANIDRFYRHAYYLATFFVEMSILMAIISFLFLDTYCIFCIATYVCSFVIFFCAKQLNKDGFKEFANDMKSMFTDSKSYLSIYLLIPICSFAFQNMAHGEQLKKMNEYIAVVPAEWERTRMNEFTATPNYKVGASDADAKVIIVEFADYLCPHCKFALPGLKAFVKSKPDVQLRFYNFPLSSECNPAIQNPNAHRCRIASVSQCAESMKSMGAEVSAELFEGQGKYMSSNIIGDIASKFGFSEEELKKCVESPETNQALRDQAAEGEKAKIRGTPSIFMNGKKVPFGAKVPFLNAVYEKIKSN